MSAIPFGNRGQPYVPAAFEPHIRDRVLAGNSMAAIAAEFGADETRLCNYVFRRIKRWRAEGPAPASLPYPSASAKPRITVYRPFPGKGGNIVMRPVRLPYVTMHAKMLEERRHG